MFNETFPCIFFSHAGHFCSSGSSEPFPVSKTYGDVCPVGHFCPQGSGSPTPCPVGSFLPDLRASTSSQCYHCPPGKYCSTPGSSQPTGLVFPLISCSCLMSLINAVACQKAELKTQVTVVCFFFCPRVFVKIWTKKKKCISLIIELKLCNSNGVIIWFHLSNNSLCLRPLLGRLLLSRRRW